MKQPKYKKKKEFIDKDFLDKSGGIIPLAKGYGLIVPKHSDSVEIMTAIGTLVQILALADKEQGVDYNKFKLMINEFVDMVYKGELKKK